MIPLEPKTADFVSWFRENAVSLRHEPAAAVADQIAEELLRIDEQLGVEVADGDKEREVIVTAFSDPRLFPVVRRIAEWLSDIPGWQFVPLKPPRGFAFKLTIGEHKIDASSLEFAPIPGIEAGIELVPSVAVLRDLSRSDEAEEMAWLIVETGIGEELAGRLQHVEFSSGEDSGQRQPIGGLAEYVRTHWA